MNLLDLLLFVPSWFACALYIGAMLFCVRQKKRKFFWLRFIPCSLAYNVLPFVIPGSYNASYLTAGWFSFSYIIFALLLAGLIYLCFQVKIPDLLFFVTASYALQNLAFHLWSLLCSFVYAAVGTDIPRYASVLIGLFVYATSFTLFYYFLVRRARETLGSRAKKRIIAVSAAIILIVYVLDMYLRVYGYGNIGIDILTVLVNTLLLAAQGGIFRESKYEREQEILTHLIRQESKQHKLSEENVNIMNVKFHDLKHRISEAKRSGEGLDEIEGALDVYDAFVKSGCDVLDIVLTEKQLICKHKNIKLGIIADGTAVSFMSDTDISALFGNILDNAIEAVESAEQSERIISLNVSARKGFLSINEDNFCADAPVFENGLPKTIKADAEFHGFGTKSIKMISEKYGGKVLMTCNGNVFYLEIIIPIPSAPSTV